MIPEKTKARIRKLYIAGYRIPSIAKIWNLTEGEITGVLSPRLEESKPCPERLAAFNAIKNRIGTHSTRAHPFRNLKKRLSDKWKGVKVERVLEKFGPSPKCYLTGIPLDLTNGQTFELEHIIPRTKGGLSTLDNMQFANPMANRMKHNFDLGEFIRVCHLVARKWS